MPSSDENVFVISHRRATRELILKSVCIYTDPYREPSSQDVYYVFGRQDNRFRIKSSDISKQLRDIDRIKDEAFGIVYLSAEIKPETVLPSRSCFWLLSEIGEPECRLAKIHLNSRKIFHSANYQSIRWLQYVWSRIIFDYINAEEYFSSVPLALEPKPGDFLPVVINKCTSAVLELLPGGEGKLLNCRLWMPNAHQGICSGDLVASVRTVIAENMTATFSMELGVIESIS